GLPVAHNPRMAPPGMSPPVEPLHGVDRSRIDRSPHNVNRVDVSMPVVIGSTSRHAAGAPGQRENDPYNVDPPSNLHGSSSLRSFPSYPAGIRTKPVAREPPRTADGAVL